MLKQSFLKIILLLILLITVVIVMLNRQEPKNLGINPEAKIKIGNQEILAEIVQTNEELEKGLSGKKFLAENAGMYFDLSEKRIANFWMKDMNFPIDIIWIDGEVIVGIEKNAPTPTNTVPTFTSPQPVTNVLEVNAGFSEEYNIKIGDRIQLKE